jgi:hypothetical protein
VPFSDSINWSSHYTVFKHKGWVVHLNDDLILDSTYGLPFGVSSSSFENQTTHWMLLDAIFRHKGWACSTK